MKYLYIKDKRRRILYYYYEKKRKFLKTLFQDLRLSEELRAYIYNKITTLPRDSSITRIRNRCTLTNRPRAIYKKFGLSRLMFRKHIWQGNLVGVKKSSW